VLVAETAMQFVDAVNAVLTGAAPDLGALARARVEADYDWFGNLQVLDGLFANAQTPSDGRGEYPREAAAVKLSVAS
jgi:hypothetical protein